MEKGTNLSNLIVDQGRNLHHLVRQVECACEPDREKVNVPEPEMGRTPVHSEKEPFENEGNQEKTKLCIKNMVSLRCKMAVKAVLENLGLNYTTLELGEVEIIGNLSEAKQEQLKSDLLKYGLELVLDKKIIIIEKIKKVIIEMVHYSDELPSIKFSDYLSKKLNHDYTYLSNLFSEVKGITIMQFVMLHKIERVKELLVYDELSLKEISYRLHYSSVAHLSSQFKHITGLTPTCFKNMKQKKLSTLDSI